MRDIDDNKKLSLTLDKLELNSDENISDLADVFVGKDKSDRNCIELYKVHRDYIKHEDNLINQRVSRTLLAHGFLIATYVLLVQAKVHGLTRESKITAHTETLQNSKTESLDLLLQHSDITLAMICFIGLATSIFAWIGIRAAANAIDGVKNSWSKLAVSSPLTNSLPGIVGGGNEMAKIWGNAATYGATVALILLWSGMLTLQVVNWFKAS